MEFEDILHQVGGYGKYQKYLTCFFLIPVSCLLPWIGMNTLFMVAVPEHWCNVPAVASSNLSIVEQRALVSPPQDPSCSMYDVEYKQNLWDNFSYPNTTQTTRCASGWQYDKSDYESTASTKWNMVCDHSYFPSLVLSFGNVGSVILTPLYSFLADRYGRKTVYLLLAIVSFTMEIASILVNNFIAFTFLRAIHGSVLPNMFTLPFILLLEIVAPEMRAHMNGIINSFWTVGLALLPLIVYLSGNWVKLGLICASVCACNLIYFKYIPESPCWLISRGRYEEATHIMEGIGRTNGKSQDYVDLYKKIKTLGEDIQKKKETENSNYFNVLLTYPRVRRHFFILAFGWTTFNITYFGPMYNNRNLAGNEFVNFFLLSIIEIPGNFAFWILMDRVGRRWTASIGFIVIGFVNLGPLTGLEYSDIVCSMLGKFISTGLFMVTDQQGSELFPTVARSFFMGLGKTISASTGLFIPFFADLGAYEKTLPFVVMSCTGFIAGVLASFLPETLNENLPQTISDAEEYGKCRKFFSWKRKKIFEGQTNSYSKSEKVIMDEHKDSSCPMIPRDTSSFNGTEADTQLRTVESNPENVESVNEPLVPSSNKLNVEISHKGNVSSV